MLNGRAGALVGREDQAGAIERAFAAHGQQPLLIPTDAGDLPHRIRLACDSGAETVVVVGGDGTVACAAQLLAGTKTALGIIPSGTMNLLARDVGLPIDDLAAAVGVIVNGHPRAIDVGDVNGHVFLCGSMTGLPTRLARFREASRGNSIVATITKLLRPVLRVLAHNRPMRLALEIDGARRPVLTASMTVTVNQLGDATGRQFGRDRLDGGVLGVYIFRRLSFLAALRVTVRAWLGRWRGDDAVDEFQVRSMAVTGRRSRMHVMNDGEVMALRTPLAYSVRPLALLVVAP